MATFNGPGIRVLKQYEGQDGKTYVQLDTGETLATDSSDYEDYYSQGLLYGEDERGNIYPQEGAHDLLIQYQNLTKENSFENYMKPYFENEMTGSIAKGLGQSMDKFWEVNPSFKQKYDNEMRQTLVNQFMSQNPVIKNDGFREDRGPYLDRITKGIPDEIVNYILDSGNPSVQPSYWEDFSRGIDSVQNEILPAWLGGGDRGLVKDISKDNSYTNRERNMKINDIETGEYNFLDRSSDQMGIFSPLAIPAKFVQSMYKDDYQLNDALTGRKNDANFVEDVVTDPLTYVGAGVGKSAASNLPGLAKMKTGNLMKLMMEEPLRFIPGRTARTEEALKEANDWSRQWYSNPEFQNRVENMKDSFSNAFDEYRDTTTDPYKMIGLAGREKKRVNAFWDQLGENARTVNSDAYFQTDQSKIDRLFEGKDHLHSGNSGVTYGEYTQPDKYLPMTSNGQQAFVNRALSLDNIISTGVHESNHIMMTPRMHAEAMSTNLERFFQKPFDKAMEKGKLNAYYSDPKEIYARIQEFRKFNNIEPGQKLTADEVFSMKQAAKKNSKINKPFFNFNSEDMAKLLNSLPAAGAGVGLPAWLFKQEENDTNPNLNQ